MSSDQPGHSLDPDEVGWLSQLRFNEQGLLAAIAQDYQSGRVLMLAWMNEASLRESFDTGYAVVDCGVKARSRVTARDCTAFNSIATVMPCCSKLSK
jgi:phosphoribosyl-AMP cyclohydrolase